MAPHDLKGVPIDVGTVVNAEFTPNNFNPKVYKKPRDFNPERWL